MWKGSLPGNLLRVWSVSELRGGDVYRVVSDGRGVKVVGEESMTQLCGR